MSKIVTMSDTQYQPKDLNMTHYIYEIPDKKIGCTKNITNRMKAYPPGTEYIIRQVLEDITDEEAGETELVWQCRLGYPRDSIGYEKTAAMGRTGDGARAVGKANVESGHWERLHSIGGKASCQKFEHQSHAGKKGGEKSLGKHWFNNGIVQGQSFDCPEGFVPGMLRKSK